MNDVLSELSESQWELIAVLEALGGTAPMGVVGALALLPPSQLIDLSQRVIQKGLLLREESAILRLNPDLPDCIKKRLKNINTPSRISYFLERLQGLELPVSLSQALKANLLAHAGRDEEAAILEHEVACRALRNGKAQKALEYFDRAVDRLSPLLGRPEFDSLFVMEALELSYLRFRSGKKVGEVMGLLKKAREAAKRLGDRRSLILINLHMGRHVIMENRPDEGLRYLSLGLDEVKKLGDNDILARSEEFQGLYYYIHGRFKEAVEHFEVALQKAEWRSDRPVDFLLPQWLSFSYAYLGQVQHAIGLLKSNLQRALHESELALADDFRATLGIVLLISGKRQEAFTHLQKAFRGAVANHNPIGQFHSLTALAYYYLLESKTKDAYDTLVRAVDLATEYGVLLRQYTWPWFLDMLYEFHKQGYEPIRGFSFHNEIERILKGPNLHLQGTALRLRAKETASISAGSLAQIWGDLEASENKLRKSGSSIELAKTWVEMARHKLHLGEHEEANRLALRAWRSLSGFSEDLFPKDLRHLLDLKKLPNDHHESCEELLTKLLDLIENLTPSTDLDKFLYRILRTTGKLFGTERGCILWFSSDRRDKIPLLRTTYNFTDEDLLSDRFSSNLDLIMQAHKTKKPVVVHHLCAQNIEGDKARNSVLCVPFEVPGEVCGVLYHDSPHFDECFDSVAMPFLERIARCLGSYIERIWDYCNLLKEKSVLTSKQSIMEAVPDKWDIKGSSPVMKQLLALVDRVADSEAPVLITGETGVGKELLARRLHKMNSKRSSGPLVVVDITSIPENLLESELFGHEKGAFTGADKLKPGRLELAHGGTLFIDEVGDIPLALQVKLLRVLQEKTFFRIGGTQAITSDFRLVAATNRNMEDLVARGHFRKDLFYRINVVPMVIPPLRERGKDIILLARYFLDHYMRKYKKYGLALTSEDEAKLSNYKWPGNVRELQNVIERAVLLSTEGNLDLTLPCEQDSIPDDPFADTPTIDDLQRRYI
ncbi:MAG: sigma 54-interacting transcriptional regulator, partial [Deltaproteobacteria bacterium]|nr:sigma 54-interacting transcriptional regulator [Deltaproteobacteria bacterium]MBW2139025.1 sigma 54-interacting transcriptional regulator [Deltaproteobacteria bacterium]